jgi:Lon protease-like protein
VWPRYDSGAMADSGDARTSARAGAGAHKVVPLFPLPGLFLFPGTALPLHIFEARYRQMVEDLLDTSGRFVLGTVMPGHEKEVMGAPPVHCIAGLGEIARHQRLPDGRFVIFVIGLTRVRLSEVESDRPYRKVEIAPLVERAVPPSEADALRRDLMTAVKARSPSVILPPDVPLGQLTDLLLLHLRLDVTTMIDLYSRLDIGERARGALDHHARTPIPPPAKKPPTETPESPEEPPAPASSG